jgi:N-acetylmuramoyl-L-alanine amidase
LATRRFGRLLMLGVLALGGLLTQAAPVAAGSPLASFTVSGSPFAASFAPLPPEARLDVDLVRSAKLTLTIRRPDGTLVKRLARRVASPGGLRSWTWAGADSAGRSVADGRYVARLVVIRNGVKRKVERPLRKGLPPIYPVNPGALVITVDPGHGGRFAGATRDGFMEKDFNLDIGLALGRLLEGAGVTVVMTRSTDVAVNDPPSDVNQDGKLDRYDDDLERNDIANLAGSDVDIHVHNNASRNSGPHGTETYTSPDRTWTPQAIDLAQLVLDAELDALRAYRSADFKPTDAGVHTGWYYYVGPYDPPFLPRPALPLSVLSESLYVSNAKDLAALRRADVRLSIAAAIYVALAEYLNTRPYGVGYAIAAAPPATAVAGAGLTYRLRVTNRGNVASKGWRLRLAAVPAVALYDGSGARGAEIGSLTVPDGLGPGQSVELVITANAPAGPGDWLVKTDITLPDGSDLSDAGVVPLQLALTTTIAP